MTMPNYFLTSDSDYIFQDQLFQTWQRAMENQFKDVPEMDRFVAVDAACKLFCKTIATAFAEWPEAQEAALRDVDNFMRRIDGWKKVERKAS